MHILHIKILGVILLRVNIIAIATVNSEINLKTGSFPKNVFLHICNMIIQIFHQHINFLTPCILAPRQKLNFLQKPPPPTPPPTPGELFAFDLLTELHLSPKCLNRLGNLE